MPRILQLVQSAKDKINELHMKWKLVNEINKFMDRYNEMPSSIKQLSPEFTHILKLVDYNALSREPVKYIHITIPFDWDKEKFEIEIEWEEWGTIKYADGRDHKEYVENIERKSIDLSLEKLEEEKEFIKRIENELNIHTQNVNKLEEFKLSNEYLSKLKETKDDDLQQKDQVKSSWK